VRTALACLSLALLFALSGCATMLHGSTQSFMVESDPSGATVSVYSAPLYRPPEEGMPELLLLTTKTPATIVLGRGRGWYREAAYRIVFEKEGYQTKSISLKGSFDFNVLWNILPPWTGWGAVVDVATGSMWTLNSDAGDALKVKLVAESSTRLNSTE